MKWKFTQKPEEIVEDPKAADDPGFSRFVIEPLEPGFGVTLGNAIRRVLLSSLQGVAITSFKMKDVPHEFTTLEGILEDMTDIVLNLKNIRFKLVADAPGTMQIKIEREGEVTAADIEGDPNITVLNPELHIATTTKKRRFDMQLNLDVGKGYRPAEENTDPDAPIGTIPIDSIFSPIIRVNYKVEPARVGRRTDYDKLILEIHTDQSVHPREAVSYAAQILNEHFGLFIKPEMQLEREETDGMDEATLRTRELLKMTVDELELSVRARNCLNKAGIDTIAQLVQKTESDMLQYRNFGKKSLQDLIEELDKIGLSFGMDISNYKLDDKELAEEDNEDNHAT